MDLAFSHLGLNYRDYVEVDSRFYRPAENVPLCGDARKIRQTLGWQPTKPLPDIIAEMVEHDLRLLTS